MPKLPKFKKLNVLYIIIFIIIIVLTILILTSKSKEQLDDTDNQAYSFDAQGKKVYMDPKTAKEACQEISTRADEIEAEWGGAQGVVDALTGMLPTAFLNPRNYQSGSNASKSITRNVLTTDLSEEDIRVLEQGCEQISNMDQSNIIDVNIDDCPYCLKVLDIKEKLIEKGLDPSSIKECSVANVRQSNTSKSNDTCTIQTAIEILRDKKNSVDAQALAEVLQKAQGIMSGNNKTTTMNCNVVSTDMSSKSYFEQKFKCNQDSKSQQENKISGCSNFQQIEQENNSESMKACMSTFEETTTSKTQSQSKATAKSKVEQTTEGISTTASLGSSISSAVVSVVFAVVALQVLTDPGVQQMIAAGAGGGG